MSEPLKEVRHFVRPQTHRVLTRIAKAKGLALQELGREIIEEFVRNAIHDAKVVLGQDDDNAGGMESHGSAMEDAGSARSRR